MPSVRASPCTFSFLSLWFGNKYLCSSLWVFSFGERLWFLGVMKLLSLSTYCPRGRRLLCLSGKFWGLHMMRALPATCSAWRRQIREVGWGSPCQLAGWPGNPMLGWESYSLFGWICLGTGWNREWPDLGKGQREPRWRRKLEKLIDLGQASRKGTRFPEALWEMVQQRDP